MSRTGIEIVRRLHWAATEEGRQALVRKEWLVTNGLGGYASGTVSGGLTRRYHGLLVAALPTPFGRTMMFNCLRERVRRPGGEWVWMHAIRQTPDGLELDASEHLESFVLESGLPVWTYSIAGVRFEKRVLMPHQQNTTHIAYRLLSDEPVRLELQPLLALRLHEAAVSHPVQAPYGVHVHGDRFEIDSGGDLPPLRLFLYGRDKTFVVQPFALRDLGYVLEQNRGYDSRGDLWAPGHFRVTLAPDAAGTLVASTESWETIGALRPEELALAERMRRTRLVETAGAENDEFAAELVLAADQFIITPAGRVEEAARARAEGDEVRTVVAGYHWFTDWGRDAMISLEGLTICTGRQREAGYILRTFGHYVRDGLIPNMFPEGTREGLYHTADASLWFFHAIHRYLQATADRVTRRQLIPRLLSIVEHHLRGTRFGIRVDPGDGLLAQGEEGYQLTWMDAKVDDWVVTPRRGKAVEINALWYNALSLLAGWLREEDRAEADRVAAHAARARESFNRRFWYAGGGYLYDVVDSEGAEDDTACRPNQILAIALDHPVLDRERWDPVFTVVRDRLQTPVGLRSLAPGHRDYKPQYYGDLRARDAAYHQGTVWGWLAGPFADAWLKVHPEDTAGVRRWLEGFRDHLSDVGVGTLSEIFDADEPFHARGCIAQAWSVAEVLRAWRRTSP